jgi:hypothetical protein
LVALKGKSELKELIASTHKCEKKNDSDFHSKSVLLKEPTLVVEEHINQKETTTLDFREAGVLVHFTSDYHATKQLVQAEKSSKHQTIENQDRGGEKGSMACQREVISSNIIGTGLTGSLHRSDQFRQNVVVGCYQEKYDIIHIKVPRLSKIFDKVCFASNSQLDPIFSVNSFISDSIMNDSKRLLTVKIRQPSHEFTFGVGMSFIPYPLVLTPVV